GVLSERAFDQPDRISIVPDVLNLRPLRTVHPVLFVCLALAACDSGGKGSSSTQVGPTCPHGHQQSNGICSAKIALDSVGFLPGRAKSATLVGLGASFQVKRADGSVVMSGQAIDTASPDTMEQSVRVADFSALTEPGEYYLEAAGP